MDANSGAPWSEMDISDLENELVHGVTWRKQLVSCAGTRTRFASRQKELGLVSQGKSPQRGA